MSKIGVLFAHPNPEVCAVAASALEAAGYSPHTVSDGLDVMWWLDNDRDALFDIVVIATEMPRLDGIGTLHRVKKDPRLEAIHVLVYDETDRLQKAVEDLGARFFKMSIAFVDDLVGAVRETAPA
jgi:two-component system sensor histidine kinase and response regulator WspE